MLSVNTKVVIGGPLFSKDTSAIVKAAATEEALGTLADRIMMTGKRFSVSGVVPTSKKTGKQTRGRGLGVMRNTLADRRETMKVTISSTLISPRTVGSAWTKYNLAIAKSLVPRAANKAAARITAELGAGNA